MNAGAVGKVGQLPGAGAHRGLGKRIRPNLFEVLSIVDKEPLQGIWIEYVDTLGEHRDGRAQVALARFRQTGVGEQPVDRVLQGRRLAGGLGEVTGTDAVFVLWRTAEDTKCPRRSEADIRENYRITDGACST